MSEQRTVRRSGNELNPDELAQLGNLLRRFTAPGIIPGLLESYHNSDIDFYLFYNGPALGAVHAVSIHQVASPFARRKLPLLRSIVSLRDPEHGQPFRDFARRTNFAYIREKLGPFWILRPLILFTTTVNARALERLSRTFPEHYPKPGQDVPLEIIEFANGLLRAEFGIHDKRMSEDFVRVKKVEGAAEKTELDITAVYHDYFAAKDDRWNAHFHRHSIYRKEGDRIFLGENALGYICLYRPWTILKKRIFG